MKKIILRSPPDQENEVILRGKDFHYLVHVLRVKPGSVFKASFPDSSESNLKVISVSNDSLRAECSGQRNAAFGSSMLQPVYLFQALPKAQKMDLIVRQAAETGVTQIVPFYSEFSQIKNRAGQSDSGHIGKKSEKVSRWERIIREARQQSDSVIPTSIIEPCEIDELFEIWRKLGSESERGLGIFLHQETVESGTGAKTGFNSFHECLCNNPGFVVLAIGPEGGFSPVEVKKFTDYGFNPLKIGDNILRTETAALYGIAAIRTLLTEIDSWLPRKDRNRSENG